MALENAASYRDARLCLWLVLGVAGCGLPWFGLLLMGAGMENETPPWVVAGLVVSLLGLVGAMAGLIATQRPPPPSAREQHR
jgi:hypothetical protein